MSFSSYGTGMQKVGSQEIPEVTDKFGIGVQNDAKAKANRVFPREPTGHRKHPFPITHEKTLPMGITRWSILKSD